MKKVTIYITAFIALFSVVGCGTSPRIQRAIDMAPVDMGGYVPCSSGCKAEWERAQLWLAKHSRLKIQTATDVMIDTYNPVGQQAIYRFTITKEPTGNDNYKISMSLDCGNALGCIPESSGVERVFLYYVRDGVDVLDGQRNLGSIR